MFPRNAENDIAKLQNYASVFAALGDETRLSLVSRLTSGRSYSISQLAEGSKITRQAVTKHLRVLEGVGLVHSTRNGREQLYHLDLRPFKDIGEYLRFVSEQWDEALSRLKSFVEDERK